MTPIMLHRRIVTVIAACLLAGSLLGPVGCRDKKPERKERTITGTALAIDEATHKVAMSFYNKKKQIEMKVEGIVTPETEILINGRVAQLNEIKIGEQVVVTGYQEGRGQDRRIVATRIEVEREEWSRGPQSVTKPATKPTTKPAGKPAGP